MITGVPIISSSAMPAGRTRLPVAPANCTCDLMNVSKIGSPIFPVPGHCVWFIFSGKSPRSRAFVQIRSSSSAVRIPRLPSIGCFPSGPGSGTYADRPRAG